MGKLSDLVESVDDTAELMDANLGATVQIRLFDNGYVDFEIDVAGEPPSLPALLGAVDLVKYSLTVHTVGELASVSKLIQERRNEKVRKQSKESTPDSTPSNEQGSDKEGS